MIMLLRTLVLACTFLTIVPHNAFAQKMTSGYVLTPEHLT